MGLGWTIDGKPSHRYIAATSGNSNNVAEYLALIEVLTAVTEQGDNGHLIVTGDSQLVVNQMSGEYAVKAASIVPLWRQAQELVASLRTAGWRVAIRWAGRESNVAADAASKAALAERGVTWAQRTPDPDFTDRLGDIADELEITAIAVGKPMTAVGVRVDRQPSTDALATGIAQQRYNGHGLCIDWHVEKTCALIRAEAPDALSAAAAKFAAKRTPSTRNVTQPARQPKPPPPKRQG